MHDRFRKKHRAVAASGRLRQQIALEAARRLMQSHGERPAAKPLDALGDAGEEVFYLAKRKAAAVLGHRIRPGDLPSDDEVREQFVGLWRTRNRPDDPEPEDRGELEVDEPRESPTLAEKLDRFTLYRMRLLPLESLKQNPKIHPEGDALYHSLQVFELARESRPYDEEFLLAALLHDVGKAIDPQDHVAAGVEALRGAVTERTLRLIAHHMDLPRARDKSPTGRPRKEADDAEFLEDLSLLRDLDDAGRVPGVHVDPLDDALAYIKGLEHEAYLDG